VEIPEKEIREAGAFILNLGFEEDQKLLDAYYLEQPRLSQYIHFLIKDLKDDVVKARCEYLYLVIFRSFRYYGIKIPPIAKNIVFDSGDKVLRNFAGHDVYELSETVKSYISQPHLLNFVNQKIFGTAANPISYLHETDLLSAYYIVIQIIYILNNAMSRFQSADLN
jgi:hypothetical protein